MIHRFRVPAFGVGLWLSLASSFSFIGCGSLDSQVGDVTGGDGGDESRLPEDGASGQSHLHGDGGGGGLRRADAGLPAPCDP
jgi:hypothetical protein